ncbi:hypothetical protein F2Q68_00006070 [Brassica cretica]|uniref:NB-ARC domain-containing protein n=1 Tax=Brassica cretica TaxID=69181 RepID=A0A8S9J834_BRACR|nr:hypothetical protein F2Q68_00006070 [Brassica cretica]
MDSYFSLTNIAAAAAISFYALFGTMFFNRKSRSHQENKAMASSSLTLPSPPSSLPRNWIHHAFPSFHGADVHENFLSHLVKEKTEVEMIAAIVTDVLNKLNLSAPCSDFDSLVGMESHMTIMGPLLRLDFDEVRKIGILGPPGIGKTAIARSLFIRYSQDFQLSVFIDDIKTKYAIPASSDDYSVKLYLQEQFMSQLTNEKDIKIPHLGVVKDRLKDKKFLIVLDDVNNLVQLEAMAHQRQFHFVAEMSK